MKIIKFHMRIHANHENRRILHENQENHDNLRITCHNTENHEKF